MMYKNGSQNEKIIETTFAKIVNNDLAGVHKAIVENKWLLQSRTYPSGVTLLHEACWRDLPEMAELLLRLGADVNAAADNGSPPIAYAIYQNASLKTIQVLLQYNPSLGYSGPYEGPLYWASVKDRTDVVEALLKAGVRHRATEVLANAIRHGNEALVDILIENNISVNSKTYDGCQGCPMLMFTVGSESSTSSSNERRLRIAKKLLARGADVNVQFNKSTPLYWAITYNKIDLVKLFVEYDAKLDIKNYDGVTPLLRAARFASLEIFKFLLAKSTKENLLQVDRNGGTALHYAAMNPDNNVCQYLLDLHYFNPNVRDNNGNTPLHWASRKNDNHENVRLILNSSHKEQVKSTFWQPSLSETTQKDQGPELTATMTPK